ncbi:MAG: Gfo/Idh/MocA family oxidoreductase [Gemmatimonadota bacterium]|nr:Gfo/Idh/MocA family oxidoreductase [Gemmatimonadota bacterium]
MQKEISRRSFLKASVAASLASSVGSATPLIGRDNRKVRVGFVGVGSQGTNLLRTSLAMDDIEVPAICDIDPEHLGRAQRMVERRGLTKPEGYSRGPGDFKRMSAREDLDAIITATPWEWHVPVMVDAMRNGKYGCTEVPAAYTVEGCWDLVNTSEETGVPCMMLENHCYQKNNLAVLNMVRAGLFGDLLHGECGYQHDVRFVKFGPDGELLWRGKHSVTRNGDLYTTHGLGPVAHFMDICRGDYFEYLTSTASRSLGLNHFVSKKFGPDHPNAKRKYALGDIVTTVIRTFKGLTITINHDTQSPRPYSNMTKIQGAKGLYNELAKSVYIEDLSPEEHRWEPFGKYQEQYNHQMWKDWEKISKDFGHGGTDYLKLRSFYDAVRDRKPTPIDIYDSVAWCVVTPLSEQSVAGGSVPVKFPDFTRGKWRTSKPVFGV